MVLTDAQGAVVEPWLPKPDGRARSWKDTGSCFRERLIDGTIVSAQRRRRSWSDMVLVCPCGLRTLRRFRGNTGSDNDPEQSGTADWRSDESDRRLAWSRETKMIAQAQDPGRTGTALESGAVLRLACRTSDASKLVGIDLCATLSPSSTSDAGASASGIDEMGSRVG